MSLRTSMSHVLPEKTTATQKHGCARRGCDGSFARRRGLSISSFSLRNTVAQAYRTSATRNAAPRENALPAKRSAEARGEGEQRNKLPGKLSNSNATRDIPRGIAEEFLCVREGGGGGSFPFLRRRVARARRESSRRQKPPARVRDPNPRRRRRRVRDSSDARYLAPARLRSCPRITGR